MTILLADPSLPHQLPPRPPWSFWRDGPDGGRQGFVFTALACSDPECPCDAMTLVGHLVDDTLVRVEADGRRLEYEFEHDSALGRQDLTKVSVDVHTLTATVEPAGKSAVDPDVLAWLRTAIDIPVLDRLHAEQLRLRGLRSDPDARSPDLGDWQPGDLLSWRELFPYAREDGFRVGERTLVLSDHYCADPACMCTDVHVIAFERSEIRAEGAPITIRDEERGRIRAELPDATILSVETDGMTETELRQLWSQLAERRGDLGALFESRARRVKEVGRELYRRAVSVPDVRATPRVGRNAPCPCGSGRKYKHCCGKA